MSNEITHWQLPAFNGQRPTVLQINGEDYMVALEMSGHLGYSRADRLAASIRGWTEAGELVPGKHHTVVEGEALASIKRLNTAVVSSRAPSLLLLTPKGLERCLMLARTDIGREFRDWLQDVALPALRERGVKGGDAAPVVEQQLAKPRRRQADPARLAYLSAREERLKTERRARAYEKALAAQHKAGLITPEQYAEGLREVAELLAGGPLPLLRQRAQDPRSISPSQIAHRLKVSRQKVGRVISALKLRPPEGGEIQGLSRSITTDCPDGRSRWSYLYSPRAVELIREALTD